ncbi:outer membrane beta-barrel protein [Persicobacter psychrovividus]
MKKGILILALITMSFLAHAQDSKFDIRMGGGWSFIGSGDYHQSMFESELNYKSNHYFAFSAGFAFSQSYTAAVSTNGSMLQLNGNAFISPFKNNRRNDFRIGLGLSNIWITSGSDLPKNDNSFYNTQSDRTSLGANLILENTFAINDHFLIGIKGLVQAYGDTAHSGILGKIGYRF